MVLLGTGGTRGKGSCESWGVDGLVWSSSLLVPEARLQPRIQKLKMRTQGFVLLFLGWHVDYILLDVGIISS